jgi:hypothetical protein
MLQMVSGVTKPVYNNAWTLISVVSKRESSTTVRLSLRMQSSNNTYNQKEANDSLIMESFRFFCINGKVVASFTIGY